MIDKTIGERRPVEMIKNTVESRGFNLGVVVLILLGAVTVGLCTYPVVMARWGAILNNIDLIIIGCFTIETLLRIFAELPRAWRYFSDPWNIFDFVIVVLCLLPLESDAIVAIRIIRLLRVLRIFRAFPKLRLLIRGILHSLTSVGYVAALLILHFYIFAIIGVTAFSTNDIEHFGNLGKAFLTLFQVLTLENWPDVMAPVKEAHPNIGVLYFITFIVSGTMVVMNLFVGVIVGGMSQAIQEEKDEVPKGNNGEDLADIRTSIKNIEEQLSRIVHQNDQKP